MGGGGNLSKKGRRNRCRKLKKLQEDTRTSPTITTVNSITSPQKSHLGSYKYTTAVIVFHAEIISYLRADMYRTGEKTVVACNF